MATMTDNTNIRLRDAHVATPYIDGAQPPGEIARIELVARSEAMANKDSAMTRTAGPVR